MPIKRLLLIIIKKKEKSLKLIAFQLIKLKAPKDIAFNTAAGSLYIKIPNSSRPYRL
jgi:hypothetical protein